LKINKKLVVILIGLVTVLSLVLIFNFNSVGRSPELLSLSKSVASPGDTIVLKGKYFGGEVSRGRVYINDKMIFKEFIKSWSNDEIIIELSDDFKSGMIVVDNMFGQSSPYLITSLKDVPEIRDDNYSINKPFIRDAVYSNNTDLKIDVYGNSFGTREMFSLLKIHDLDGNVIDIDKSLITQWHDYLITFFIPYGIDNMVITVENSNGISNEFALHRNDIPPVIYIKDNNKKYQLKQIVDIYNVITLGEGSVELFLPTVFSDYRQDDIVFDSALGSFISKYNVYNYQLNFYETGENYSITLNTSLNVSSIETKIRREYIGRVYDKESPAYIDGFSYIPNVDKSDKDISGTGVWLVRNSKNRVSQAEIIIDWILKYIKIEDESSDNASIAFKNRSASNLGLINITTSMLRSIGIPSRVVYGIKIDENVSNYRWLEFYLPSGGWVPVDLVQKKVQRDYPIGTLENNIIGFSKGLTFIDYQSDNLQNGFYALQNSTSNFHGNIESYDTLWHNIEIK